MRVSLASSALLTQDALQVLQGEVQEAGARLAMGSPSDLGLTLGSRTVDLLAARERLDELQRLGAANGLVQSRLEAMQECLASVGAFAERQLGNYMIDGSVGADPIRISDVARQSLTELRGLLNSAPAGQFLLSGENADQPALRERDDNARTIDQAGREAFVQHFGIEPENDSAGGISAAALKDFIEGPFDALFSDPQWSTWSGASTGSVRTRIGPGEHVEVAFVTRLWSSLIADLGSPENALAIETRARLVSIGLSLLDNMEDIRAGRTDDFSMALECSALVAGGLE